VKVGYFSQSLFWGFWQGFWWVQYRIGENFLPTDLPEI
jgi:hypothetical protein